MCIGDTVADADTDADAVDVVGAIDVGFILAEGEGDGDTTRR